MEKILRKKSSVEPSTEKPLKPPKRVWTPIDYGKPKKHDFVIHPIMGLKRKFIPLWYSMKVKEDDE